MAQTKIRSAWRSPALFIAVVVGLSLASTAYFYIAEPETITLLYAWSNSVIMTLLLVYLLLRRRGFGVMLRSAGIALALTLVGVALMLTGARTPLDQIACTSHNRVPVADLLDGAPDAGSVRVCGVLERCTEILDRSQVAEGVFRYETCILSDVTDATKKAVFVNMRISHSDDLLEQLTENAASLRDHETGTVVIVRGTVDDATCAAWSVMQTPCVALVRDAAWDAPTIEEE